MNSRASSSSSNVMADFVDAEACWYDVFLSFCGQDTRNSFADHLYQGLNRVGIGTFRDNEGINKGEHLKPEIERAIKDSRASIVVLSKNYAKSTWCLDELVLILEQRRDRNHFVLPVFYGVEPTDVRNQRGDFALQVKPSSKTKWTYENVNKWKAALTEVATLAGHVLSGLETNFLKDIANTIYNKLDEKDVGLPPSITGMDTWYEVIKSWLHQSNLEFLAIYGMGGSGKTTLAKHIYRTNRKEFESVSFLEDIGYTCKRPNGLLAVQEQLITDISGEKWKKVPGVSRGQFMIGKHLQMNRALIVLDGIVGYSQLVDLLGTGRINAHSKIIITTRENPDKWFRLSHWRCQIYEMRLLNDNESLEVLSSHAFGSKIPMLGYEELIPQAIQYCEGNPLALEVLGSSIFKNTSIQNCRSQLNLLEKHIDSRIHDVLVRSYMSLPSDTVKELFLHIACFFIGKDMDYVVKILELDFSALSGIEILVNTCLVSVSPNKTLMMHRLHQEMGKNVVFQESTKFPAKRSRIWLSRDSYNILSLGEGSKKVEGLAIDMKMLQNEGFAFTASELTTDALKSMDSLKLLQLNFVKLVGSYERFSKHLRWLCWHGFHLRTIPSDLYMGNLVAIDMSYSNLEVFEPPMVLQSLQILNLKDSHDLFEIRSIFKIPHLETLILWNCFSLVNVCERIGDLKRLALLNMTGCKNLITHTNPSTSSFPRSLHQLLPKDCHLICTDSLPLMEIYDEQYKSGDCISTNDEMTIEESDPYSHKIVLAVNLSNQTKRQEMLHALSVLQGIESHSYDKNEGILTVIGDVDPEALISHARKIADINFSSVGPASERHAKQHERRMDSSTEEGKKPSLSTSAHPRRIFSLTEVISATDGFANELIIGKGGSGTVYKGQILIEEARHLVAIKRLNSISGQFWEEIDMLSTLRHSNLVSLIGYCHENNEMILVYEFMPNGNLYHHLHKDNTPLSWLTRLKIAIGAARGLEYLHIGVGPKHGVIHCDVKSSNILLDARWEAMISDFGISKITNQSDSYAVTTVIGTYGYMDPDYFHTGKLTRKSDVYAFGLVLFELLSGRLVVDPHKEDDQSLLVTWAQKCVKEKKLDVLVDPNIKGTISAKCLSRFVKMAARCVCNNPKERPTMSELVASLQASLELQEKCGRSAESSGIMSFPRKIYKYFVPTTKPNSGQSGTSSQKNLDEN